MTIEQAGITWRGVHHSAQFTWDDLAGIGISYYQSVTEETRKKRMPQLDIYEREPSPVGRWPELDRRRRFERPPALQPRVLQRRWPQLPGQRYRLMLPLDDTVYRMIEEAVRAYRPQLWLGWYRRSESDTPLLLH
ncbi:hypothetical protein [Phytoactinopolyspora halotolerans]|uniref:Uncharacterized protein n=1 Tax=Phytoactinopolyspora halotolerans TaxID=1981512 RepID=A0A6L9SA28_9ACTN|nr:hypothetical protein [Phytoactinopolyspora halotolerans]NEE01412.1 hypothetical protein [Phytoactinopolyspora halotolerans]